MLRIPRHTGEVRLVFMPGMPGLVNYSVNGVRVDATVGESDSRELAEYSTKTEQSVRVLPTKVRSREELILQNPEVGSVV